MIKRSRTSTATKVTFVIPVDEVDAPVSVVGDFNDWDPYAHPLRRRSNDTRSVAVTLPPGEPVRFRYLVDGGRWLDEPDAEQRLEDGTPVNVLVP